jgi:hypothetical protein
MACRVRHRPVPSACFALLVAAGIAAAQTHWVHVPQAQGPPGLPGTACFVVGGNSVPGPLALVFGGLDAAGPTNASWLLTTAAWQALLPATSPSPRWDMAASSRSRTIFGGRTSATTFSDETWWFAPVALTWIQVQPVTAAVPPARAEAALAADQDENVLLFGGRDGSQVFGDTWVGVRDWSAYDRIEWVARPAGPAPSPRFGAALGMDPVTGSDWVLFGGRDAAGGALGDTWVWSAATGWFPLGPTPAPPPRSHAVLVTDVLRDVIVLHGGRDAAGVPLTDVWELEGSVWTQRAPGGAPPPALADQRAFYSGPDRADVVLGGAGANADLWRYEPVVQPDYNSWGLGCGSFFTQLQLSPRPPYYPRVGRPWGLAIANLHQGATLAFLWAGWSTTSAGGMALPLLLDPWGLPGCRLYVGPELLLAVPAAGGAAVFDFAIPGDPLIRCCSARRCTGKAWARPPEGSCRRRARPTACPRGSARSSRHRRRIESA